MKAPVGCIRIKILGKIPWDILYDGELTPSVCSAICEAWKNSGRLGTNQSGYGALRWSNADTILGVDVVKRQLRLGCSMNLCD